MTASEAVPGSGVADLRIRSATPGDEPFLWTALYHAVHVPFGAAPPPPEIVRRPDLACYVSGWMRPGDLGVVAELDGVAVGAAWLRRWSADDRGYGFVDDATPELSMALLPGHRGRGIGTSLLRRLLAESARTSATVSLSVSATNPARRLYERFGFVAVGEIKGGSVTMLRRLGAA